MTEQTEGRERVAALHRLRQVVESAVDSPITPPADGSLRDRLAEAIYNAEWGEDRAPEQPWSEIRGVDRDEYQAQADAALRLLGAEAERLTAEVEHHRRQHELWARLHTGEHEFVQSLMTQGEIGIWLVAESRELLRGMARRVGAWRRTSAQHYAEFYEAVQEWQRNDEQMLAENQRIAGEVARLREQLATAVVLPRDAEARITALLERYWADVRDGKREDAGDDAEAEQAHEVVKLFRLWSAPVSESVPAIPEQDEDEHVPTLAALKEQRRRYTRTDEGRPSGSGAAAPRSDDDLVAHLRNLVTRMKDNDRTGEEKGLPNEIAFDDGWCGAMVHAGHELETLLDQYGPNGWDVAAQAARSEATPKSLGRCVICGVPGEEHATPQWCMSDQFVDGSWPSTPSLPQEGGTDG